MDTIQQEKNRIRKREQMAQVAFSLLILSAFLAVVSLATSRVARTLAILNSYWFALFVCALFFFLVVLGSSLLGPYMQKTQRQKQNWLNEYGQHILAAVTKHPVENALIIGGRARGRNASYTVYLNWQDPQTEQFYSFCINTRFSSALGNLPEGTLYPVQFDPSDLSFFIVPRR
jgi:hypothetical protein